MNQERVIELAAKLMETMPKTAGAILALTETCQSKEEMNLKFRKLAQHSDIREEFFKAGDVWSDMPKWPANVHASLFSTEQPTAAAPTTQPNFLYRGIAPTMRGIGGALTGLTGAAMDSVGQQISSISSAFGGISPKSYAKPSPNAGKLTPVQGSSDPYGFNASTGNTYAGWWKRFGDSLQDQGRAAARAGSSDLVKGVLQNVGIYDVDQPSDVSLLNQRNAQSLQQELARPAQKADLLSGWSPNAASRLAGANQFVGDWAPQLGTAAIAGSGSGPLAAVGRRAVDTMGSATAWSGAFDATNYATGNTQATGGTASPTGDTSLWNSDFVKQLLLGGGLTLGTLSLLKALSGKGGMGTALAAMLGIGSAAYGAGGQGYLGENGKAFYDAVNDKLTAAKSLLGIAESDSNIPTAEVPEASKVSPQVAMNVLRDPSTAQQLDTQLATALNISSPEDWSRINQAIADGSGPYGGLAGSYASNIASRIRSNPRLKSTVDSLIASGQLEQAAGLLDANSQLDSGAIGAILQAYRNA